MPKIKRALWTGLPLALACLYHSQLRDVRPAANAMSPAAIATRLAPIAHVLPAAADTKVASRYPGMASTN